MKTKEVYSTETTNNNQQPKNMTGTKAVYVDEHNSTKYGRLIVALILCHHHHH